MLTGDWLVPVPQVGNPMVFQCSGPIGDAGSWFHATVVAARAGLENNDAGPRSETTPIAAAVAPAAFNRSRRVSSAMTPPLRQCPGPAPNRWAGANSLVPVAGAAAAPRPR